MPTTTPDERNDGDGQSPSRLDREIDEILASARADSLPRKSESTRPVQFPYRSSTRAPQWSGLLAPHRRGALMIVLALVLAMLAVLVSDVSRLLANLLVIAAIVAFAYPIVTRARGGGSRPTLPPPSRTWRGRDIDISPRQSAPIDGLKDWWNRRQRR